MRQLTLRISEDLADDLSRAAAERGESVNRYATAVLGAAVDPELAGDETTRIRERLARAGLLMAAKRSARPRPPDRAVREAGKAAGRGRQLSEIVTEGRR